MRRALSLLVAMFLLVVLAACSSSNDEGTTTSISDAGTTDTTLADESSDTTVAVIDDDTTEREFAADAMCRTLALFSAARVPPPSAAEAMTIVDLDGATSEEMAAYGDLLIGAPSRECPEHLRYAEAIQYWLGF